MPSDTQTNKAADILSNEEWTELIKPGSYYDADDLDELDREFLGYAKEMTETNPFRSLILKNGPTFAFCKPMSYPWASCDPLIREFAEKVDFPKDRDILIYCWLYYNQIVEVDNCFILDEDDCADFDDTVICFADFPEVDFQPLYDLVAQDALNELIAEGYDMTGFHQ